MGRRKISVEEEEINPYCKKCKRDCKQLASVNGQEIKVFCSKRIKKG